MLNGAALGGPLPATAFRYGDSDSRWLMAAYDGAADKTRIVQLLVDVRSDGETYARSLDAVDAEGNQVQSKAAVNAAWANGDRSAKVTGRDDRDDYGVAGIDGYVAGQRTQLVTSLDRTEFGGNPNLDLRQFQHTLSEALPAGGAIFSVRAVDAAGNEGTAGDLRVVVDNQSDTPSLILVNPPSMAWSVLKVAPRRSLIMIIPTHDLGSFCLMTWMVMAR
jgi:hypothetical protein